MDQLPNEQGEVFIGGTLLLLLYLVNTAIGQNRPLSSWLMKCVCRTLNLFLLQGTVVDAPLWPAQGSSAPSGSVN